MHEKITPIVMPKWGLTMSEGTLSAWHVAEGQTISPGQEIMDVETEKIANAVEAADGGLLRRRVAQVGQVYPVKSLLGVMAPVDGSHRSARSPGRGSRRMSRITPWPSAMREAMSAEPSRPLDPVTATITPSHRHRRCKWRR